MTAGAGPRHLVFHPSGRFAYVVQELNSTVSALAYDTATGAINVLQTVPALPDGYTGNSTCSDIHITPEGRYVYAANRGHDSLAIYAVDQASGHLTVVGHQSTGGAIPRGFGIDPTGTFVLAGNQDTDNIVVFRINQTDGKLTEVFNAACGTPVCLKLIEV
jgi:6-phosphogluconolactonase